MISAIAGTDARDQTREMFRRKLKSGELDDTLIDIEWIRGSEFADDIRGDDGVVLRDVMGDRAADGYFAAWIHTEDIGDFLFELDPEEHEPITVGRFVPTSAKSSPKAGMNW